LFLIAMQDENKSVSTLLVPSTSSSGQNSSSLSSISSRKRKISEQTNIFKCKTQYTQYSEI